MDPGLWSRLCTDVDTFVSAPSTGMIGFITSCQREQQRESWEREPREKATCMKCWADAFTFLQSSQQFQFGFHFRYGWETLKWNKRQRAPANMEQQREGGLPFFAIFCLCFLMFQNVFSVSKAGGGHQDKKHSFLYLSISPLPSPKPYSRNKVFKGCSSDWKCGGISLISTSQGGCK